LSPFAPPTPARTAADRVAADVRLRHGGAPGQDLQSTTTRIVAVSALATLAGQPALASSPAAVTAEQRLEQSQADRPGLSINVTAPAGLLKSSPQHRRSFAASDGVVAFSPEMW
jgi:hypothetical protein